MNDKFIKCICPICDYKGYLSSNDFKLSKEDTQIKITCPSCGYNENINKEE